MFVWKNRKYYSWIIILEAMVNIICLMKGNGYTTGVGHRHENIIMSHHGIPPREMPSNFENVYICHFLHPNFENWRQSLGLYPFTLHDYNFTLKEIHNLWYLSISPLILQNNLNGRFSFLFFLLLLSFFLNTPMYM